MDLIGDILDTDDPNKVLITVTPALARRILGAGAAAGLGILLVWLGFSVPNALGMQLFQLGLGGVALAFAVYLWRVSATALELTTLELRERAGRVLTPVSEITKVERGMFAFKPSNGLLVVTRHKSQSAYVPGIWWRIGRWIGIGGLTNAGQSKAMGDVLAVLLKRQNADAPGND